MFQLCTLTSSSAVLLFLFNSISALLRAKENIGEKSNIKVFRASERGMLLPLLKQCTMRSQDKNGLIFLHCAVLTHCFCFSSQGVVGSNESMLRMVLISGAGCGTGFQVYCIGHKYLDAPVFFIQLQPHLFHMYIFSLQQTHLAKVTYNYNGNTILMIKDLVQGSDTGNLVCSRA